MKLWNHYINESLETVMTDLAFKQKIKLEFLFGYRDTLEEQGVNLNGLLMSETINFFPHEASEFR